jgi:hypothetical protein
MHCSLLQITLAVNSSLAFWKMLVFEFLLSISENFLYSMTDVLLNIVLLLEELQVLMLFVVALTYLEPKVFLLIKFYNFCFLTINYQNINCTENLCMYTNIL